ncbi:MAG: indolepyruvate oxidoreductase subunit beta [Oscillospiraceae bacterium]|jgi:indolepyruvate ferredoxin oxidoreductase beta subunit|nr:indolepyruvate oxidoreductase subunit beta [Oscillospiraceae bacterium]
MKTKSIMIVGVGGQGSLLAGRLLGCLLMNCGYDVKVSEVHGMSQRGGSVVTYVRYGGKVRSPVIDEGGADFIVSFELLEAARWLGCLAPGGKVIANTQRIDPMPVVTGAAEYPSGLAEKLKAALPGPPGASADTIDALSLAVEAGSSKAVNIVLMGRLSRYFADIPEDAWLRALKETVPAKTLDTNTKAFSLGRGCEAAPA